MLHKEFNLEKSLLYLNLNQMKISTNSYDKQISKEYGLFMIKIIKLQKLNIEQNFNKEIKYSDLIEKITSSCFFEY